MAELARRAATRAWVRRRLTLLRQADFFSLAASGSASGRGIVGAADQAIVTGAVRPTVTRAPLAGTSVEVALVLPHAVARSAWEIRVVWAARRARRRSYPALPRCSGSRGWCTAPMTDPWGCSRPRTACRSPVPQEDRSGHSRSRGASCRHRGPASRCCNRSRHPVATGRCRPPAFWVRRVLLKSPTSRTDWPRFRRCLALERRGATDDRPAPAQWCQTVRRPWRLPPHGDLLRHGRCDRCASGHAQIRLDLGSRP